MTDTARIGGMDRGAKVLTLVIAGAVGLMLLPYLSGLVGALALAVLAAPLLGRIDPQRHHSVAAAAVFVLFLLLVLPGIWLVVELIGQIPDALRTVEESGVVRRVMTLRVGGVDLGATAREASNELVAWSSRQTMALVTGTLNATLNLVIALFGTYYVLVSGDALWAQTVRVLPFCPTMSEMLRARFLHVTESMLLGVVLTGAAQATMVSLAFTAVGLPHALFWGAVTFVVSMLPIVGSSFVWLPGAAVLFVRGQVGAAVTLIAVGVVVISNVDNVLRMVVYRRVGSIHPMVTLVGAFAGGKAFGIAGLVIGPLMLSYALELLTLYRNPPEPELAIAEAA